MFYAFDNYVIFSQEVKLTEILKRKIQVLHQFFFTSLIEFLIRILHFIKLRHVFCFILRKYSHFFAFLKALD